MRMLPEVMVKPEALIVPTSAPPAAMPMTLADLRKKPVSVSWWKVNEGLPAVPLPTATLEKFWALATVAPLRAIRAARKRVVRVLTWGSPVWVVVWGGMPAGVQPPRRASRPLPPAYHAVG